MPRSSNLRLSDPRQQFTCCLCLHVRTGTIIFGISQIIMQLVFISLLFLTAFHPGLLLESSPGNPTESRPSARFHALSVFLRLVPAVSDIHESLSLLPLRGNHNVEDKIQVNQNKEPEMIRTDSEFLTKDQDDFLFDLKKKSVLLRFESHKNDQPGHGFRLRQFSPYVAIFVTGFSLAFCCFMVHGAITRQPSHLLPFFFIQVFDLIICLLHILGFLSSASDLHFIVHTNSGPVYVKSTSLTFVVLSISCLMLAFKVYCLGMVWDCYKYLMLNRRCNWVEDWYSDHLGSFTTLWRLLRWGRRSGQINLPHTESGLGDSRRGTDTEARPIPPTYDPSNDLPKYEDILKIPANAFAPPPYFCVKGSNKKPDDPHDQTQDNNDNNDSSTNNNNTNDQQNRPTST